MPKKTSDTPDKIRPQILIETVKTAREIITEKYGEALANSLGDGDAVDLAMLIKAGKDD